MRPRCGPTAASPLPVRKARSTRAGRMCKAPPPATAGPSGTTMPTARSSRSTLCARWRGGSSSQRLSLQGVGEHFPHHAWQRGAVEIADMDPAATLRLRGPGELRCGWDLGGIDGKLKVKMGEGVLDEARHLAPLGSER